MLRILVLRLYVVFECEARECQLYHSLMEYHANCITHSWNITRTRHRLREYFIHISNSNTKVHDEENMDITMKDDSDEPDEQPPPKLIDLSQRSVRARSARIPIISLFHVSIT